MNIELGETGNPNPFKVYFDIIDSLFMYLKLFGKNPVKVKINKLIIKINTWKIWVIEDIYNTIIPILEYNMEISRLMDKELDNNKEKTDPINKEKKEK